MGNRGSRYQILVEEAFGYTKLIYLKYTSKMCEVYFPKVSKRSLKGWTFSQIPKVLEIVHIFTIVIRLMRLSLN